MVDDMLPNSGLIAFFVANDCGSKGSKSVIKSCEMLTMLADTSSTCPHIVPH